MSVRLTVSLLAALVTLPSTTFADSTGNAGAVVSLTVHESTSDDYGTHRGRVMIREGSEPGSAQTEYRWGGTLCQGRNLSDANIALLMDAFRSRSDAQLIPRYKNGQAGIRCLTSFTIQEPVYAAPR